MRVLFTSALVAALASASSAPAPSGNTAKRNIDQHLAPHRFDSTKTLIEAGTTESNSGAGKLEIRVVIKADDADRSQQELHTTLTLSGIELTDGQEVYLGWAMQPTSAEDLCPAATGCEATAGDKLDDQGTPRSELATRAAGAGTGWDGVNYMRVYNGSDETGGWTSEEIWNPELPAVPTDGIAGLMTQEPNAFLVENDYGSLKQTEGATTFEASVYSERVWDSQEPGHGYKISSLEKAFDFIGWYYVYDPTACGSERLLQAPGSEAEAEAGGVEEDDTTTSETTTATPAKDWNTVCPTTVNGQSVVPQIFVLGALSGIAVASAAILTTMLF